MNAAEIETATRVSCGFTILLFNDDYGLISEKQVAPTGGSFGTRLTNPDFVDFADSFGIESYRPESSEELHVALHAAVGGELSLVDAPVE